ncbi:MAG: RecX family transcriptional regulator [Candidatus Latescibacteria bacterium]|nr:RecX family transcriptional regulator [Candidatus Latescibacterota bacterium]
MRVQLKPQKRNPERTSVYINGKFCFGVDKETLERLGYFTKSEISDTELKKLFYEAERTQARNYAFRLLSYRMRTRKEMQDRLRRREYSDQVKKDVMDELEKLGLLDDRKFAETFARDRLNYRLKGRRMISAELIKRGIDNKNIKTALADITEENEEEACKQLIRKYSNRYRNLSLSEKKQKYYGLLTRRGFSYPIIKKALKLESEE